MTTTLNTTIKQLVQHTTRTQNCSHCNGSGRERGAGFGEPCPHCDGSGEVTKPVTISRNYIADEFSYIHYRGYGYPTGTVIYDQSDHLTWEEALERFRTELNGPRSDVNSRHEIVGTLIDEDGSRSRRVVRSKTG